MEAPTFCFGLEEGIAQLYLPGMSGIWIARENVKKWHQFSTICIDFTKRPDCRVLALPAV
jgi:hypothetical protein